MKTRARILEQWLDRTLDCYAGETVAFLQREPDPFRNPVGQTLQQNLTVLLQELFNGPDLATVQPALAAMVRLRAVQELSPGQALGFLFQLRPILREALPLPQALALDAGIDQLVLLAFEEYLRCREQLAAIRLNESRRALAVPAALARGRS